MLPAVEKACIVISYLLLVEFFFFFFVDNLEDIATFLDYLDEYTYVNLQLPTSLQPETWHLHWSSPVL